MLAEETIIRLPRFSETASLDRIKSALCYADLETTPFPWVHVAGSKGKGSVSTMVASILKAAGYKTGLFTSPHVHDIKERITIDNRPIDSALFNHLYESTQKMFPPELFTKFTFFETMTLLAVLAFQKANIDIAVFETGLGGRLDPTTAISDPTLSIITYIELEHTAKLGNTLEAIAQEKAGIIRSHTPVLMAKQELEAALVIQERTSLKGVKLYSLDQLSYVQRTIDFTQETERFTLNSGITGNIYPDIIMKPLGAPQVNNASVAITASELLTKEGFIITENDFRQALLNLTIPCRFEMITHESNTWILDGAHTFHSCSFLASTMKERYPNQKIPVIFGCKHNKNARLLL